MSLKPYLLFLTAFGGACSSSDSEHVEMKNDGALCVSSISTTEPSAPIRVAVLFNACLSSSCSVHRSARCSVEVNGSEIHVSSIGEWDSLGGDCTLDCGSLVAHCESVQSLAAGTYTIVHGSESHSVVLPTEPVNIEETGRRPMSPCLYVQ